MAFRRAQTLLPSVPGAIGVRWAFRAAPNSTRRRAEAMSRGSRGSWPVSLCRKSSRFLVCCACGFAKCRTAAKRLTPRLVEGLRKGGKLPGVFVRPPACFRSYTENPTKNTIPLRFFIAIPAGYRDKMAPEMACCAQVRVACEASKSTL